MSPAEVEALALLAEECGEVVQAIGKSLRHGLDSYHPAEPDAGDNAHRLARELGDVQAAIAIVQRLGIVDWRDVNAAMQDKLARVTTYLHSAEVKAAVVAERGGR